MRKAVAGVSPTPALMEVLFQQLVLIPPVPANRWRTNKEAEAAKAAYHHNKSSLGVGGGRGCALGGGVQEGEGHRRNHGGARGAGVRGSQKRVGGWDTPW